MPSDKRVDHRDELVGLVELCACVILAVCAEFLAKRAPIESSMLASLDNAIDAAASAPHIMASLSKAPSMRVPVTDVWPRAEQPCGAESKTWFASATGLLPNRSPTWLLWSRCWRSPGPGTNGASDHVNTRSVVRSGCASRTNRPPGPRRSTGAGVTGDACNPVRWLVVVRFVMQSEATDGCRTARSRSTVHGCPCAIA